MFSWCVHFVHNTNLFIKSKYVYIIIQSRTFWYFVRQLSERGRIMFFHFIIYLYQYLYKVFHVMVGLTVYWYTLYSGNDCQYTCRSLSLFFYVKKIYISIYLYFFYCKFILWKIKIFWETLSFTCLKYICSSVLKGVVSRIFLCEFINLCSRGAGPPTLSPISAQDT